MPCLLHAVGVCLLLSREKLVFEFPVTRAFTKLVRPKLLKFSPVT